MSPRKAGLPKVEIVEARVEAQRMAVFETMAVVSGIEAISAQENGGGLTGDQACNIDMACRVVRRLLNEIANRLDPGNLLKPDASEGGEPS
jgi:hypothetical protein